MTYHPQPIDTSEVVIDTEHLKLTELLAKNTHEIWAKQRLADGWQYGSQRDDTLKQHPGLIPYEDLPDSEKEYDRLTALGVIKTLLALGYRLEGQRVIPSQPDPEEEAKVVTLLKDLKKSGEINISSLLNIHRETIKIKPHTPIIYQVLGEAILQLGEPLPSLEKITTQDYWTLATLGEASLILQQWSQARDWYQQAIKVGQRRYGDLSSTRRNAKILLESLEGNSDRLTDWFKWPRLAVFSGHMIDLPDRPQPRFPAHLETQIYQAIRERLSQLDVGIGYASAACGSDILFLEAILERKGEIHLVLPYSASQFIPDCVDIIPDSNWKERFNRLLDRATEVNVANDGYIDRDWYFPHNERYKLH